MKHHIAYLILICFLALTGCENAKLESLYLSHQELTLQVGQEVTVEVIHIPLEATPNNRVSWKTSDSQVATVDSKGKITAVYTGSCVITAYCGTIESKCSVTVSTVYYDLELTQGLGYIYGDADQIGANHLIIRLLDKDLQITETGDITGNGYFMNIEMNVPFDRNTLPSGSYISATNAIVNSFLPGELYEIEGSYYAAGTYMGYYGDQGLSAAFVDKGLMQVNFDGSKHNITLSMVGKNYEVITATFEGTIPFTDRSEGNNVEIVEFLIDTCHLFNYADRDNVGLNVVRMQLFNKRGDMIRLDGYVPLSMTDTLPVGTYKLGETGALPYRLIHGDPQTLDGCWYNGPQGMQLLRSGQIIVGRDNTNRMTYKFSLYDSKKRLIQSIDEIEKMGYLRIQEKPFN